eukprot:c17504_g1_i1 orf=710-931(+)
MIFPRAGKSRYEHEGREIVETWVGDGSRAEGKLWGKQAQAMDMEKRRKTLTLKHQTLTLIHAYGNLSPCLGSP